ncbi:MULTISPECIES: class I SAM-dependent methyltransferase [Mycobacteriaceae]|uniref:Methyltransferase domain-containing protein n=1 Tax=Mycolicibacterium parafortuitum TaxID=39692 RepID=A0ACC6MBV6_MYCPF|nr:MULTISPECIES: methyltransferase domain-containing protein [Mycobacteriaceae]MDZ5084322.1 methyltransferase domain-containing protein [Mycolicibacterium parafortuitum]MEC9323568.1 methyltransferase domain-containing protein [Actinomycetota bacterium]GFM17770.1 methyltransferase family protein [Mycobacterium sp. PO1]GFM24270.1 methyltransferase family protein [Mycobacterium sp. PO2]
MAEDRGAFTAATGRQLEAAGRDKPRYRRYQYDLIAPHCGRTILEVGAGLGEFAEQFGDVDRLVLTDVDPGAVELMARRFAGRPEVQTRTLALGVAPELDEPVASVVAINVLEHIEDDAGALRSLATAVQPGGSIVLWVPGYQQLYGEFDRKVGHVRRYTPSTLASAVRRAGLDVELVKPVNLLGGIAWWLTVRRGGSTSPDSKLVAVFDRFVVPVTRALERVVRPPFGQSVLCVARVRA